MSPLSFYRAEKRVFPCLAEPPTAVLDAMYLEKPSAMKTSKTSESVHTIYSVHPPGELLSTRRIALGVR